MVESALSLPILSVNDEELNPKAELIVLLEGGEDNNEEGVGERRMDNFDSGGKSVDKVPGAEDESAAPLPEKNQSKYQESVEIEEGWRSELAGLPRAIVQSESDLEMKPLGGDSSSKPLISS